MNGIARPAARCRGGRELLMQIGDLQCFQNVAEKVHVALLCFWGVLCFRSDEVVSPTVFVGSSAKSVEQSPTATKLEVSPTTSGRLYAMRSKA